MFYKLVSTNKSSILRFKTYFVYPEIISVSYNKGKPAFDMVCKLKPGKSGPDTLWHDEHPI